MRSAKAFLALLVCRRHRRRPAALAQPPFGAQGPEGAPNRAQPWRVPSPDADVAAQAVLFRPPGEGPFRLALIAHATTQNALRRAQMPQPEYRALAAFLVARGFAVLVPERLGHGATGGKYLEDQGGCDDADYAHAGARHRRARSHWRWNSLRAQSFIRQGRCRRSSGIRPAAGERWRWPAKIRNNIPAIIAFAPGRGGHANDVPNQICAPQTLMASAGEFGKRARVPVTWLVAANDTYFSPDLSRQLADAFRSGGGKVDFRVLAASGSEGHWLVETDSGVGIAGAELDRALKLKTATAKKPKNQ